MEPAETTLIEVPVILTHVESCDNGVWTKFECFSDALALGRSYKPGARIQITIIEISDENHKR